MGQAPSKGKSSDKYASANSAGVDSTLPIIKSDTQGSTRSLRGSIRSKIGRNKDKDDDKDGASDAFSGTLPPTIEKADNGSSSNNDKRARRGSSSHNTPSPLSTSSTPQVLKTVTPGVSENTTATSTPGDSQNSLIPPPSPVHSDSIGRGHHALDQGNREVDHVSDAPPGSGSVQPSHTQQPKESILIRRPNAPNPIAAVNGTPTDSATVGTPTADNMQMSALKSIDLDDMITRLLDAGYAGKVTKAVCLKNAEITAICQMARELFLSQPALIELSAPVKIVGDVHGQYTDLIRMFEMCGFPPNANYLFLGDYVDRGKQSLETILLLLCYKLKFPENFFLLRGNHECANVTRGT